LYVVETMVIAQICSISADGEYLEVYHIGSVDELQLLYFVQKEMEILVN